MANVIHVQFTPQNPNFNYCEKTAVLVILKKHCTVGVPHEHVS